MTAATPGNRCKANGPVGKSRYDLPMGPWRLNCLVCTARHGVVAVLLLLAGAATCDAAPALLQGTVTTVGDGDSLRFEVKGQVPLVVRLRDIDAPELCQPWGAEARAALSEMTLNKPATLQTSGRDEHGRALGVLRVDGADIGARMVEDGHAWSIRTRWDQGPLVRQERMARALARGLHAAGGAVQPRDFRSTHGPCDAVVGAMPALPVAAAPERAQRSGPAGGAAALVVAYRCDGRTRCAQMRSCDEAMYFAAHCPGVTMDGNRDGVPCERQWCAGRRR